MNGRTKVGVVAGGLALALLVVATFTTTSAEAPWVSALAASVSALGTIVTATVAVGNIIQARRDNTSRTRPVVAAWMRPSNVHGYIDIVVGNLGASVAKDVTVKLVGLPDWTTDDPVLRHLVERYRTAIPTLVPNLELSNIYTSTDQAPAPKPPDAVTVHLAYTDEQGRPYSDSFPLDASLIKAGTTVTEHRS